MKECAVLLAVFSAFTVSINSALADTFGSGGQRVHHRLGRYRRRREQASSTSPVKKQMPGINIMTKIRVASFACACLLAFYLPSTSHADVMTSPLTHSGGVVDFRGSSSTSTRLAVAFTSMTPILLEFYRTDSEPSQGIWLTFLGEGGTPGIRNLTGVPWAGIEFRTAWSVLAQDPLFRDDYFYFEPNTGSTDSIFFARTALNQSSASLNYRYLGTPYWTDVTFGLFQWLISEYPLFQTDDEYYKLVQSYISDIAQINFAPGMPQTSGLTGEMYLFDQGTSGESTSHGYYYVLITPIAASVPVEPFAITNFTRSGNTAELRWQPLPNNTPVRVERTTDLSGPWTAIATNLISGSFNDTNAPTRSAFYRLVTEP